MNYIPDSAQFFQYSDFPSIVVLVVQQNKVTIVLIIEVTTQFSE